MSVIKTNRSIVYAYEPEADDTHVQTLVRSPTERYVLTTQGIDEYQQAVESAVAIADQMDFPLTVLPITAAEFVNANRERLERGVAALTDQERGELRQVAVASMLTVMRDCPDPEVRADAYQALKQLKVVP
jgi:hypothetical protein